jgi:hypothetical protein
VSSTIIVLLMLHNCTCLSLLGKHLKQMKTVLDGLFSFGLSIDLTSMQLSRRIQLMLPQQNRLEFPVGAVQAAPMAFPRSVLCRT